MANQADGNIGVRDVMLRNVILAPSNFMVATEVIDEKLQSSIAMRNQALDYFVVEDERGMRYWIYPVVPGLDWLLHGVFG
jgi:hypothetical protein